MKREVSVAHVFVAGASRRVGFETVKAFRAKDYEVTCFFRNTDDLGGVEATGARAVIVDAFDAAAVAAAVCDAGPLDALICTLGGKPGDEPRIDHIGAKNCIDAAQAAAVGRFLFVTAIGCGDTWDALEEKAQRFLGPSLEAKNLAEANLFASDLKFTVLRPGSLLDDPPTSDGFLTQNTKVLGAVTRADVAAQLVRCLESDRSIGQVYQVLDRSKMRTETLYEESTL
jgi:nucleoside-diphosphate-sugar epimerase